MCLFGTGGFGDLNLVMSIVRGPLERGGGVGDERIGVCCTTKVVAMVYNVEFFGIMLAWERDEVEDLDSPTLTCE